MTFSIILQASRPAMVSVSKRSLVLAPLRAFSTEKPKFMEQAHHQVAPLTDATLYAPQGHSSAEASISHSATTETIFTPSVNAVFDD